MIMRSFLTVAAAAVPRGFTEVDTPLGRVRGTVNARSGVYEFKGLRYAASTAGKARYSPSTLSTSGAEWRSTMPHVVRSSAAEWRSTMAHVVRSSVVADATSFAAPCIQSPAGSVPGAPTPAEDCLFLNVYAPPDAKRLPVLFWVHGGGFCSGWSGSSWFDGSQLAASGEVVVVTIGYRLGGLGFMVVPGVSNVTRKSGGNGGANGIGDMRTALQWVKANVASYGGDAARVTVFGESSGGLAACTMIVSPQFANLGLQRVIVQSGPCAGHNDSTWAGGSGWAPNDGAMATAATQSVLRANGVSTLAGLRLVPDARKVRDPSARRRVGDGSALFARAIVNSTERGFFAPYGPARRRRTHPPHVPTPPCSSLSPPRPR